MLTRIFFTKSKADMRNFKHVWGLRHTDFSVPPEATAASIYYIISCASLHAEADSALPHQSPLLLPLCHNHARTRTQYTTLHISSLFSPHWLISKAFFFFFLSSLTVIFCFCLSDDLSVKLLLNNSSCAKTNCTAFALKPLKDACAEMIWLLVV